MIKDKRIVAVCTSRIFDAQQHSFLKKMCEELGKRDIIVMIFCTNIDLYWDEEKYFPEASLFEILPFEIVDLLLIMDEKIKSRKVSEMLIGKAADHNIPVIVMDGNYENTINVRFDYKSGFEKIVRHIIEHHGVKRPHFMAGIKDNRFSDERIEIFKKVLADNGMEFTPDMISYGDFWASPARASMKKVLERDLLPDAVICANDIMAINIADVIIRAGYKVPEDIIVSGFDGIDEVNFCTPKIATASCDSDTLGKVMSARILDCLDGKRFDTVLVEPLLMPNESCGCKRQDEASMSALNRFNNGFYRYQDDIRVMYEVSTAMQMSDDPAAAARCLCDPILHDIHCFVFSACLETQTDYFSSPLLASEKDKYHVFFTGLYPDKPPREARRDKIRDFILESVNNNCPLIFNALDYLGKPMGFIFYSFRNYDFIDYAKTASITNTISMGLGGFINAQYKRYLSDKVEQMYRSDPLTGLYNRIGFNAEFERIRTAKEYFGKPVTVIMADLDGLKYINDTYGHEAGDKAIAAAARTLQGCCPSDTICVRFGGDEMFALITGECDAEKIIASVDEKLEVLNSVLGSEYRIAMSCGAYTSRLDENFELSEAVKEADELMYRNKRSRKLKFNDL